MPTFDIPSIGDNPTNRQIVDYIVKLQRDLSWLMQNLDDMNIKRLDARVIVAGSITADKIAAGTITANEIAAGTITADKLNVTQLSAISANLGTITAGTVNSITITGSLIQTDLTSNYPRIELSSSSKILSAESASNISVSIRANGGPGSIPVLTYANGSSGTLQYQDSLIGHAILTTGRISIVGTAGIDLTTSGSTDIQKLKVDSGAEFNTISQSNSTAATLGDLVADFNTLLGNLRSLNILA